MYTGKNGPCPSSILHITTAGEEPRRDRNISVEFHFFFFMKMAAATLYGTGKSGINY